MTEPELEPAQHDHPDGPKMGWDAGEIEPHELVTDEDVDALTTLHPENDDVDGGE